MAEIIIGFILGWTIAIVYLAYTVRNTIKRIEFAQMVQSKSVKLILVKRYYIETVNDVLYMYDYDDHKFMCQGNTTQELAQNLLKIHNIELSIVIDKTTKTLMRFVRGEVSVDDEATTLYRQMESL